MPDNRQGKNNAASNSSNSSADNIDEAIRRLKIHSNGTQDGGSSPYPERPGEPDCIYYLRTGLCGYGSNCRFNHPAYSGQGAQYRGELPERVGQPDCGYFLKTGTCKYGSTCKYHHPRDRHGAGQVPLNIFGLPMRQEEKSCPYYMRTGLCKFGSACKFNHPQPASGSVLPVTGPASFGSTGSSLVPSSGVPYISGLSTWSLPRAPFLSGPRVQSPQAYMPVVLSHSQGMVPTQGWNTYMGNMSPVSSGSILGSSLVYNSKHQGESGSGGQLHLLSTQFPERPDQPECRYFMNTGNCKYGPDCKFHHPKERLAQFPPNTLGPLGLPVRPGQAVCSYYGMYGICKYGPTCKFDHPLVSYYPPPPVSIIDPSSYSYQRNSPMAHSPENSPSKSSNFPDWVRKPEAAITIHQNSDSKDNSSEHVGSPSPPTTSEIPSNQSD